jgi:hypothetical protein
MSSEYRPRECMLASELFDGRLKKFGCRERGQGTEFSRCLTDGRGNYLFVWIDDAGRAVEFTRHGSCNDPHHILTAIAESFETEISAKRSRSTGALQTGMRCTRGSRPARSHD